MSELKNGDHVIACLKGTFVGHSPAGAGIEAPDGLVRHFNDGPNGPWTIEPWVPTLKEIGVGGVVESDHGRYYVTKDCNEKLLLRSMDPGDNMDWALGELDSPKVLLVGKQ